MKNKPWFAYYPPKVPKEIDPDRYSSLIDLFAECIEAYSALPAYENMGKEITYYELDKLSDNFAAYLQKELRLKKGERIAIQLPNLLQHPVVMFGALKAGLVVVNTNPLYTPPEMKHQLNDAGVSAIVILANFAHNLEKIIHETQIKAVVITEIGDLLGGLKGSIVNFVVKHIKKMVPAFQLPDAIHLKDVLKNKAALKYKKVDIQSSDVAFLQYTGGTTGVSKGAMLTHRNIVANMEQISAWMEAKLERRREVVITALPLYHIFALTVNCLAMLKIGAKNILITNPRDMKGFIKELSKHKFSVITGVNTLFNGLLHEPDFANLDFSHLKISVGGGMAVQKVVAEKWEARTGTPLAEGYGLTETSPVLTCNPIDGTERIGTIGVPLPNTEIKIVDDEGNEVETGTPGEIICKGPQNMPGYWQRPEETTKVFRDGWFLTGDIGVMDKDGFFRIVDRKKEMILVSGFNVYPNEVEEAVAAHPKVLEVGAIGVPDEKSGEVVKIFVVKKDPSLTVEELETFCSQNLTGYKQPKHIEFRDELPKSNVGKILRRKLREQEVNI